MIARPIAALFVRADSIYKSLPGVDAWDADRDARLWPGGIPCIAHPPCRAWSRLRHFARPVPGEREYALWALTQVRRWGGVLEHPAASLLWREAELPRPGTFFARDAWGGWSMAVWQFWWGHRASKPTWLYIVGVASSAIPPVPLRLGEPTHVVQSRLPAGTSRPHISRAERDQTPPAFAAWLVEVARVTCVGCRESA